MTSPKIIAAALAAMLIGAGQAAAAPAAPTDAELDAIVAKLESSGKLDKAFDRAVGRFMDKKRQEQENAAKEYQKKMSEAAKNAKKVDSKDKIYGNKDAPASIIVYTDMECPYCQRLGNSPLKAADESQGKANAVYRHFPLGMHNPAATHEALSADCVRAQAGDKGFYAYFDAVISATRLNGQGVEGADAALAKMAAAAGAKDAKAFEACLADASGQGHKAVEAQIEDGMRAGVAGTPTVMVRNNKTGKTMVAPPGIPPAKMVELVNDILKN